MARLIPSPTWGKGLPLIIDHLLFISIVTGAINVSVAHSDCLLDQVGSMGSIQFPSAIANHRDGAFGKRQARGGYDGHGKAGYRQTEELTSVLSVLSPT